MMDRAGQQAGRLYSGVAGISAQDYSLQESMGSMQNHEAEHLLPTDKGIVMARRMLYEAAVKMAEGIEPPALDSSSQHVRAAGVLLDKSVSPMAWAKEHIADHLEQKVFAI